MSISVRLLRNQNWAQPATKEESGKTIKQRILTLIHSTIQPPETLPQCSRSRAVQSWVRGHHQGERSHRHRPRSWMYIDEEQTSTRSVDSGDRHSRRNSIRSPGIKRITYNDPVTNWEDIDVEGVID
jgi:hypothetical protein